MVNHQKKVYEYATKLKIPWRWEKLPTLVFWPREFHGLYSPWVCKESDVTERLSFSRSKTGS